MNCLLQISTLLAFPCLLIIVDSTSIPITSSTAPSTIITTTITGKGTTGISNKTTQLTSEPKKTTLYVPAANISSTTPVIASTNHQPFAASTSTVAPAIRPDRKFDGASFVGGIVLCAGLTGVGFISWKFYKARTESAYRTV